MIKQFMTILYVKEQDKAKLFYQTVLNIEPTLDVPGMTEFKLDENLSLGLMPLTGIKKLLGSKHIKEAPQSSPHAELYLSVDDAKPYMERAIENGAVLVLPLEPRDWGDRVGYCLDPDGHVLAFAESQLGTK